MIEAFDRAAARVDEYGVSHRSAAFMVALDKVARAVRLRGRG